MRAGVAEESQRGVKRRGTGAAQANAKYLFSFEIGKPRIGEALGDRPDAKLPSFRQMPDLLGQPHDRGKVAQRERQPNLEQSRLR